MSAMGGKDAMEPGFAASEVDTSKAHPARMYDAHLGGMTAIPLTGRPSGKHATARSGAWRGGDYLLTKRHSRVTFGGQIRAR
jgi:hypothetical protein